MKWPALSMKRHERAAGGFSLIEVVIVLAVVCLSILPLLGLMGVGFKSFQDSMSITVQAAILQNLRSQMASITTTTLKAGQALPKSFYFNDGTSAGDTASPGALYEAQPNPNQSAPVSVILPVDLPQPPSLPSVSISYNIVYLPSQSIVATINFLVTPRQ